MQKPFVEGKAPLLSVADRITALFSTEGFSLTSKIRKFYMVRLSGGLWEPKIKHSNLAKAMKAACVMAEFHGKRATVIQTISSVEIVDGKPVWTDQTPDR